MVNLTNLLKKLKMENIYNLPKDFDWKFYLEHYEDLRNAGLKTENDAKTHYLNHGQFENRLYYDSLEKIYNFVIPKDRKIQFNGVNVYGFGNTTSGLGHNMRKIVNALSISNIPYSTIIVKTETNQVDFLKEDNTKSYDVNLILINPDSDQYTSIVENMYGKYNIVLWAWEIEKLPKKWIKTANLFDEIWTISEFCYKIISNELTHKNIKKINIPSNSFNKLDKTNCKKELNYGNKFTILFIFDGFSDISRKNPKSVIDVFKKVFGENENVILTIKSQNLKEEEIMENFSELPNNVFLINESWDFEKIEKLFNSTDLYISLHRSEGFGLTIMEAIYLDIPVICTNYSGNLDFCGDGCELVDYELTPVNSKNGVYSEFNEVYQWAEPNLDDAIIKIKKVYQNYENYVKKIKKTKQLLSLKYNIENLSDFLKKNLKKNPLGYSFKRL